MFNKDRLRIAKELRGLSNSEFAEKLGCSTSKVKQLLDADKEINENDQASICTALNLPLSFSSLMLDYNLSRLNIFFIVLLHESKPNTESQMKPILF